jgi:hypothetical protein
MATAIKDSGKIISLKGRAKPSIVISQHMKEVFEKAKDTETEHFFKTVVNLLESLRTINLREQPCFSLITDKRIMVNGRKT